MTEKQEHLFLVVKRLLTLRNECSCGIFSQCELPDMTVKQVRYLRTIDESGDVTFSRLAEITRTSKPTITETINKFVRMDCVYRQPSQEDGRVHYIRLTERGQRAARAEESALVALIERMADSLSEDEITLLIQILEKVR